MAAFDQSTARRGWRSLLMAVLAALALCVSAGCATAPRTGDAPIASTAPLVHPQDPFEQWNRRIFDFNETLDETFLVPIARGYQAVVPSLVRRGITNVFNNFADAWSMVNALLQGKVQVGMNDMMRVLVNTTFGLAGAVDVATELGLPAHYEDFGQTLGYWGVGAGPYIVLPVLGPSSGRETAALPLDRSVSPALAVNDTGGDIGITALQIVNARANLLSASQVLDEIALDKYSFVREAYLARRRNLVYDGNPPPDDSDPYPQERYDLPEDAAGTPSAPASASSPARP